MHRQTALLLIFLLQPPLSICRGQSALTSADKKRWSIQLSPGFGFLIAHRSSIAYLQQRHSRFAEAGFFRQAEGEADWHATYSYPRYGLVYRMVDPGNRRILGIGHALMARMIFPLAPAGEGNLLAHFSYGMGYWEKPFNTVDNYKNLAIGSRINGAISVGLSFRKKIFPYSDLSAGIDFMHFSNGSIRVPNLGMNFASIFIGWTWHFGPDCRPIPTKEPQELRRREWSFYAAGALKEKYPPGGKLYPVVALNGAYHRALKRKGLLGGGVDVFADHSLPEKIRNESLNGGIMDGALRFGIFASAGLRMGRWDGLFQIGGYLYNRYPKDGDVYNRLSLRYHTGSRFFLCMNLKSHYAKADYIEWGAGYRF